MMNNARIQDLLRQIYEINYELPWLDESFEKKLAAFPEEKAFDRPLENVHSVAEILSHLVIWRRELLNRFNTGLRGEGLEDRNWISVEKLREQGWNTLVKAMDDTYRDLENLLGGKEDPYLNTKYMDKDYGYLLEGWLHHDAYHLGQIGLVMKMLG